MKRITLLSALALAACMTACGSDATFARSADTFVNKAVGPEYLAYVGADANLTAEQKAIRVQNVTSFRNVVAAKLAASSR